MVLDAALGLIARRGYGGVSMNEIADAAGVTKPVLYDCFASKEDLFSALLEREVERVSLNLIASTRLTAEPGDGQAMLEEGLRIFFGGVRAQPDSYRIVYASPHGSGPVIAARYRLIRAEQLERVAVITRAQLRHRGVRDANRLGDLFAELLVAAAEVGVRLLLDAPRGWSPERLAATLAQVLAKGTLSFH
jgi:AcrR family transcriptional regulator